MSMATDMRINTHGTCCEHQHVNRTASRDSGHSHARPGQRPLPHEHHMARTEGDQRDYWRGEIGETAKRTAVAIFEALGAAEAKIHNIDIEKIHSMKWARWMRWWILSARPWARKPGRGRDCLFSAECGRRHGEVRAWNISGAGAGDCRAAEGRAGLFVGHSGGTGHADWRGDCEDVGGAVRRFP